MLLCPSSAPNDGHLSKALIVRRGRKATWNEHVRATRLGPRRDFAYYRGLAKPSRNKPPLTAADYYDVNSQHRPQKRGDDIRVDNGDGGFFFFNMRLLIAFETLEAAALSLSPSSSAALPTSPASAAMSDTTAGARRTVASAFILPLIRQITQTMDLASRDPNSIPTVDSGHSPACVRRPSGKESPRSTLPPATEKERWGEPRIIPNTQSNKMKGNILYLGGRR